MTAVTLCQSSHSITRLDKNQSHSELLKYLFSVYQKMMPRPGGNDIQCRAAGSREETKGRGPRGKTEAGAYLHTSRDPDWNRPIKSGLIALAINMATGYNTSFPLRLELTTPDTDSDNTKSKPKNVRQW